MNDERPTHLDLFSGIGGFALAAKWAGFRTIGFCEIDKYCQKVLAKNFLADAEHTGSSRNGSKQQPESALAQPIDANSEKGTLINANIFDLDGTQFRGVDLITGGFPCQPFSVAGKRRGATDDRAIWPQMFRIISEARPAWVLGENVPGIIPMEFDNVLSDLESIGYACRPFVIPACAVDARHRRDRVWIVGRNMGNSECKRSQGFRPEHGLRQGSSEMQIGRTSDVPDTRSGRQPRPRQSVYAEYSAATGNGQATEFVDGSQPCIWLPEPSVGRVAHGIPSRVDRLKGLGNAIVPQVAYEILQEIRKLI